ncbi:MAG: thiamine phosphate synthase, partial [Pyrinomonadaceae bacterium]
ADGVHLGQDDMPPGAARKILGSSRLIGYSTHTSEQARAATTLPIDYVAYGPIFDTRSKENPDKTVGIDGLKSVCDMLTDMPVVAIGGISVLNACDVINSGASSVAVISALLSVPDEIEERTRELRQIVADVARDVARASRP